jgi:hypothetical protein
MDDLPEWLISIILLALMLLVFLGFFVGANYLVIRPSCYAETADIGMPARYSLMGGCQVQLSDGRWIPLHNWYYIEDK